MRAGKREFFWPCFPFELWLPFLYNFHLPHPSNATRLHTFCWKQTLYPYQRLGMLHSQGVCRKMGETFLVLAKELGYRAVMFNLVSRFASAALILV